MTHNYKIVFGHGIGAQYMAFTQMRAFFEKRGIKTSTFDWQRHVGELMGTQTYNMDELRYTYGKLLDQALDQGIQVIAIDHSAGCLVGGHHINHPAMLGHIALAPPPTGYFVPRGDGYLDRKTLRIGWDILCGRAVRFSVQDQVAFGLPQEKSEGPIVVSGPLLRGFATEGYVLPKSHKPTFVHASYSDKVIDPVRSLQSFREIWYEEISGYHDFTHCDYMALGKEQVRFWGELRSIITRIAHA